MKTLTLLILFSIGFTSTAGEIFYKPIGSKECCGPLKSLERADLYQDTCGNIYLKTVCSNFQNPDNQDTLYLSVVYGDDFGPDGIKNIGEVIDLKSFGPIPERENYFKDRQHIYYLKAMYESATLSIVED